MPSIRNERAKNKHHTMGFTIVRKIQCSNTARDKRAPKAHPNVREGSRRLAPYATAPPSPR